MSNKFTLITVFVVGVIAVTAFYIVFGALWDYRANREVGLYTQQMYVTDMTYIRLHKIPLTWLLLVVFSLGFIARIILEWLNQKEQKKEGL